MYKNKMNGIVLRNHHVSSSFSFGVRVDMGRGT